MVRIDIPYSTDFSSIKYELAYSSTANLDYIATSSVTSQTSSDLNTSTLTENNFAIAQSTPTWIAPGGLPFVVRQRNRNNEIINERTVWLSGDGIYQDPFSGKAASIEFTPLFAVDPTDPEAAAIFNALTPKPPESASLIFQLDDVLFNSSVTSTESYQLSLKSIKSEAGTSLRFYAYDGELYDGARIGTATFDSYLIDEFGTKHGILATATNLAVQDRPFFTLSNTNDAQFTLSSLQFSNRSKGSFDAVVRYGDGSTDSVRLDFGDLDQTQAMSKK